MNNEKQQQAKHLYYQTELSKTQIAELLNISRRSLHYWVKEGAWDRIRTNATHLPSLLAENCYHLIGNYTKYLLSERRIVTPVSFKEAETLHRLVLTVNKLKNRSAINESMEMMSFFMDGLNKKNPQLAEQLMPHVEEYITSRATVYHSDLMSPEFNEIGLLPVKDYDNEEYKKDTADIMEWMHGDKPHIYPEQLLDAEKIFADIYGECRHTSTPDRTREEIRQAMQNAHNSESDQETTASRPPSSETMPAPGTLSESAATGSTTSAEPLPERSITFDAPAALTQGERDFIHQFPELFINSITAVPDNPETQAPATVPSQHDLPPAAQRQAAA